tara:strand:+ start:63 stop:569 length:507 start_codon:yes stop_codon:yes gene_type:complete
MKRICSVFVVFLLVSVPCLALEEPTYEEMIDKLTAITGYAATEMSAPFIKEYSDGFAETLVSQKPSLPPRALEIISDEIALFIHEQMFINPDVKALQYEAYRQYFSKEEIVELIAFYETPLGRKLLTDTPFLIQYIQEGMDEAFESVTANLVENIAPRLNKRMRENGW